MTNQKRVKCVNNYPELTVGKVYDVLDVDGEYYRLVNDSGTTRWYYFDRFEILPDDPQVNTVAIEMTIREAILLSHLVGRTCHIGTPFEKEIDSLWGVLEEFSCSDGDWQGIKLPQNSPQWHDEVNKREKLIKEGKIDVR